jgi:NAD(P)-dependent dehydrogenase (short-subunit alcohol dehydrogenase family)
MSDLSMFDLSGKRALVTGGAKGIGRACAQALALAGADVAIVDMDEENGNHAAKLIHDVGRQAMFVRCQVTDGAQVRAMVDTVVRRFDRLDIAINSAGIFCPGNDATYAKENWDRVIEVNLTGTWLCAQAEMQQMASQTPTEGKIINIASLGSFMAVSNGSYDASKAGVAQLSKTLAAQWGAYNINVNSISPGYVEPVFGTHRSQAELEKLRSATPLGHAQRPEDLYGPVLFLASRASDYVTGQNLVVDGGHTLSTWMVPLKRSTAPRIEY